MKKSKLLVRPATEVDYPQIAELLDNVFHPIPIEKRLRLWKWRYDDNPAMTPDIPPFLVGEKDEKIIGVHGLTPLRVKIKNETFITGCSCDLAVNPKARSAGMKIKVRAMKKELTRVPMSTSANEAANKITLALGGKELTPAKTKYLKAIKYSGLIGKRFGSFAGLVSKPLDWALGYKDTSIDTKDMKLENISEFDNRFDQFWNIVSGERENLFVRDSAYLNWRYIRYPFSGIEAFALIANHTVTGYAAIHKSLDDDDLPFIAILELMTASGDKATTRILLAEVLNRALDFDADTVIAKTNDTRIARIFEETGFKKRSLPISPFTYKNNTDLPDEQFDTDANWFIALGDGDASYFFD